MKKHIKFPLLARIVTAIVLGIATASLMPLWGVRVFATFNALFSQLLQFLIPLIIVGLVTPAIADIGRGAGRLLLITALIAYADTVGAGLLSYLTGTLTFPALIHPGQSIAALEEAEAVKPFFEIGVPPLMDVMAALILAFVAGLGIAYLHKPTLKTVADEFKDIIALTIEAVVLPLLPLYIFGIFLGMAHTGQAWHVVQVFITIIGIIFALHVVLLVLQYCIAGLIVRRNPLRLLATMLPAYFTALGTSSSAATIPVTLRQTLRNGVSEGIAGFTVPLCATIHLSGSALKITACALALMLMQGYPYDPGMFLGFILMLGVMMVAAPGVPGGSIMAALGVLSGMLGFTDSDCALMIALYITMDSFGTACNVTGDGAIALIVDRIAATQKPAHADAA
ncbi:MAG: dicarboxylate/amino acid:cation symporter [Bacteroidaceae bacterium]|nr:dicarboxylate/amino acid:cation symporter [Bacteroidaceae bacterium]